MDINNPSQKIVMICGHGEYPLMVYNYLIENGLHIERLIIEQPVNTQIFLKRRIKKLGVFNVLGQVLNRVLIVPILKIEATERLRRIKELGRLNSTPPKNDIISKVPSVNSTECLNILQQLNPDAVVVVNTRILNKVTLSSIQGKFINIHAGITPKYRGWHGGYWALVNKDSANCGTTIHLVDNGIDTGGVLYQNNINPTNQDNYYTYPFLQLIAGLPILKKAIVDVLNENIEIKIWNKNHEGNLYYHPTIWEYISNRLNKKVK
ncbi:formyl transferase [Arenibacter sp. N53]|uniref:formyl transferase n=1 Tax=Arenibacter TaxID=178469 RepID=UPI000CD3D31C|nr:MULTISPECIES: formyl transferase [Arenibacter]MCM4154266.1 formyl transferase [Arenibacter sp. N53]